VLSAVVWPLDETIENTTRWMPLPVTSQLL
jgi:hypothetical protein